MNQPDIATLIRFNVWANRRLLAACTQLTPEEFTDKVIPDPGWGSLRGILVHALDTEYGWRSTLQAQEDLILEAADFPDVAALKARWEVESTAWFEYVADLGEEHIHQGYGESPGGPEVWQTILHVVMHSVQHRSEAAAILTGYGHSPGELDFDLFLKEHSHEH